MVRAALSAALVWLLLEAGLRLGPTMAWLCVVRLSTGVAPSAAEITAAGFAVSPLSVSVLGLVFLRRVRREGVAAADLGYRVSQSALLAGGICGGLGLSVLGLTAWLDGLFFGEDMLPVVSQALSRGGIPVTALLVLGNVLLGPAVEEFVWRGYIRSRLAAAWGASAALVITAALFAAKHAVVDFAVDRPVTLVVVAFGLGLLGQRWGPAASTVAHVILNGVATALVIVDAIAR